MVVRSTTSPFGYVIGGASRCRTKPSNSRRRSSDRRLAVATPATRMRASNSLIEGLGDVVLGADLQAGDLVGDVAVAGHEDDRRDSGRSPRARDRSRDPRPGARRAARDRRARWTRHACPDRRPRRDAIAGSRQHGPEQRLDQVVVVDDQDVRVGDQEVRFPGIQPCSLDGRVASPSRT